MEVLNLFFIFINYIFFRFRLNLEATEPDDDDVIQIFSPINKTSSISFKLANRIKSYAYDQDLTII